MTTPTFTPADIVNFAATKDAVNISKSFNQLIGQRVVDAIEARKKEVATAMFNQQEVDTEQEETEQESSDASASAVSTEQETEESDEDTQVNS